MNIADGAAPHGNVTSRPNPGTLRLLAIDVDGTLLTSRHEVTVGTAAAVDRARENGFAVVLTTSRPPPALRPILERLRLFDPEEFICSQGALTGAYTSAGRLHVVDRHPIPAAAARATADAALAAGLAVNWYAEESWLVSHLDDQVRREARVVGVEPTVAELLDQSTEPDKILVIAPPGEEDTLTAVTAALPPGLQAQTSNRNYLEITRDDVDKASALRELCARRGIRAEAVAAIGDGMNDLAMLAFAGLAVAPQNARPEVLQAVDVVTSSNDEDGVARAIDLLLAG